MIFKKEINFGFPTNNHKYPVYKTSSVGNVCYKVKDRLLRRRDKVVCSVPFCRTCTDNKTKTELVILLTEEVLVLGKLFVIEHICRKYQSLVFQSVLTKFSYTKLSLFKKTVGLVENPFVRLGVYCDLLLPREHSLKEKILGLQTHLSENGIDLLILSDESTLVEFATKFEKALLPMLREIRETQESSTSVSVFEAHLKPSQLSVFPPTKLFVGRVYCRNGCDSAEVREISHKSSLQKVIVDNKPALNRALHGDLVAVRLPENQVVAVLERTTSLVVGTLAATDKTVGTCLFLPDNRKLSKFLLSAETLEPLKNKKLVVQFERWETTSNLPHCRLKKIFGQKGNIGSETDALLYAHGFSTHGQFPEALVASLRKEVPLLKPATNATTVSRNTKDLEWRAVDYTALGDTVWKGRRDLRNLEVCSIDPPECTDIDDALHVKFPEVGNAESSNVVEVGVHIADVSHFVKANSPLDRLAAERATSVYLVQKKLHMLPELLSSNVCSLHAGVDRLAFSILFDCHFDLVGRIRIVPKFVGKSMVRNRRAFTYSEAAELLAGKFSGRPFEKELRTLSSIAKFLRQRRLAQGAVVLASLQPAFKVSSETLEPMESELYATGPANQLVEELMVLANVTAADTLFRQTPKTALLRKHPSFSDESFKETLEVIAQFCSKRGLCCSVSTPADLSVFVASLQEHGVSQEETAQLCRQISKKMSRAVYFLAENENDFRHFGLGVEMYTHFTSPIRRYADLLVHRLLVGEETSDAVALAAVVANVNTQYLQSKRLSQKSVELYARLVQEKSDLPLPATVTKVWEGGVELFVYSLAYEVRVYLDVPNNSWEFLNNKLVKRDEWKDVETGNVAASVCKIELFDKVHILAQKNNVISKTGKSFEKTIFKIT